MQATKCVKSKSCEKSISPSRFAASENPSRGRSPSHLTVRTAFPDSMSASATPLEAEAIPRGAPRSPSPWRKTMSARTWPATLGAIMDLALVFELLIDDRPGRAAAVLLRLERFRLVDEINGLICLQAGKDETTAADVSKLFARLTGAGYGLRSTIDAADFAERRRDHASRIHAIAAHLGTPKAPLLP